MGLLKGLPVIVSDGHFPETELPCVNPLKIVWVLVNNKFFEHTDCLAWFDLYSKGTLNLLAIDDTAEGEKHCGWRWRGFVVADACACACACAGG